jgi:hypothetical protein
MSARRPRNGSSVTLQSVERERLAGLLGEKRHESKKGLYRIFLT